MKTIWCTTYTAIATARTNGVFDTSRDGATNSTLFNSKAKYESRFTAKGFICDNTSLVNSWRCSKNVCQFYTTSEVYTIFGIASVNI